MANASRFSPTNPHFFQPLLPGSQSHLKIPFNFFSKHIDGKHESKTVKLRSDASDRTWNVEMEGHRLTDGWKEFVKAHDLGVGDFVLFRHEGETFFHVTPLGPSCCEIQYSPSCSREEDKEESVETEESEKEDEKNLTAKSNQLSSDVTCFTQSLTASNLSRDAVGVPITFAKQNGLNKIDQELVLMNEEGRSWPAELKIYEPSRVLIARGWTSFCTSNKLQVGDSCTFRLLQNTENPVFQLCSRTKAKNIQSADDNIADKIGENRFLQLTLTANSLKIGKQHLPASFTRMNGLIKPGKIILVDKDGFGWSMELKVDNRSGLVYIMSGYGWKSFCATNEVGAGDTLTLELIRGGASPVLNFCSKMEQPPSEPEARAHKRARVQKSSQETRPKLGIREKTAEEGETSHSSTMASKKFSANKGNLRHGQPCSVSHQVARVKQSVVDTLTDIRRFHQVLETMEEKLEDSLQEINNII